MRALLSILLLCPVLLAFGQRPTATFTENKGQWPEQVLYRALFPGGALFVEKKGLTYLLVHGGMNDHHGAPGHTHELFKAHAYKVEFAGARGGVAEGGLKQPHYENFFKGSDPTHWGTGCGVFGEVWVRDVYPGIDLHFNGRNGLKYEFIIAPGVDPELIRMRYEGYDGLELKGGALHVRTTAGTVVEEAPTSWGSSFDGLDNKRIPTSSSYRLRGSTVSFHVKAMQQFRLTIDPALTFASYSGSSANNFGFTATYDHDGALYGGGIAFGFGYPVTTGVQQDTFSGGDIDIGVSKWLPDGSALEWSTYIGGTQNETPHSLVANSNNELFILAATGSSDYPTTPGCYDNSFNGGTLIDIFGGWVNLAGGEGYGHDFGTDIAVTHLNATATALIGSTLIGGNGNDGVNNSTQLVYNYADHFRGEIALDANQHPVVSTSTQSTNMPTSAGAVQSAFGGGVQDAYLFRLNPALTTLEMATYYGGSQDDSGYGVQFASNGQVLITGGTASTNLPMGGTPFDNSYNGAIDGYVARFSASGNSLLSSTFLGTDGEDQTYFVQLNTADEVFVVGQTHGSYPVTAGKYANPGSSQFIQKLSLDLSTAIWSTRVGNGSGTEDLSPSAFLVSDCGQIYLSGWGGSVNTGALAAFSTTNGFPLTADAFQSTTDGSDYFLMVLEPEAVALNYATYFGGSQSPEHVDGGTSRFDKNGNVYQAVCAGCWNNDDFPTTPGAWSNLNGGGPGECNLGVFKFNLAPATAIIGIAGPTNICIGDEAQFTNSSIGGTDYLWDFGDNSGTSAAQAPSHTYTTDGQFTVTMVLTNNTGCLAADTAQLMITVNPPPVATVDDVPDVCPGASVQLQAHGGTTYTWVPATALSATNISNPVASPAQETTYSVIVTDVCGSDTATVDVTFFNLNAAAGPDTSFCAGGSVHITAFGGSSYVWSPSASLDNAAISAPIATPDTTTLYFVTITSPEGCTVDDTVRVAVYAGPPQPVLQDTVICEGVSIQLIADDADVYNWHAANGITITDVQDPTVSPSQPTLYIVDLLNTCGALTDSAFVDIIFVFPAAWPDSLVCPGVPVPLHASGGAHYAWLPATGLSNDTIADPIAMPPASTVYHVLVTDVNGCSDSAQVTLDLRPWPQVEASPDVAMDLGMSTQLTATGDGVLVWSPGIWLDDSTIVDPTARPLESMSYTVTVTDQWGCKNTDVVNIRLNGALYLPNTFTPNGDGTNDGFGAFGKDIEEIELWVFNRWGELIWSTKQLDGRWDGTYKGIESPIDTYVWKVKATEYNGRIYDVVGHVNLVR